MNRVNRCNISQLNTETFTQDLPVTLLALFENKIPKQGTQPSEVNKNRLGGLEERVI